MRKGFSTVAIVLVLSGWAASAQIPRTLQIGVTNGTVTVALSSNSNSIYCFAQFETTTNLSPPITWTESNWTGTNVLFRAPATNSQKFFRLVQYYPVFQFAIFYNINMEIDSGAAMPIAGPVFCNAGIWSGTPNVTYASLVAAVNQVDTSATDPFATGKTDSGTPAANFAQPPISNNSPLFIPTGTYNNPAVAHSMLELPPSNYAMGTAAAYSTNGLRYLANAVDLYITNSIKGTNFATGIPIGTNLTVVYYQNSVSVTHLLRVRNDFYLVTNRITHTISKTNFVGSGQHSNVVYAGYSFLTNDTFVDWREGWNGGSGPAKKVQALQIDISKFNVWLTNKMTNLDGDPIGGGFLNEQNQTEKGRPINSIYVYNSIPLTSTTLPAVRVINGSKLPSSYGLTVATPFPMYVLGNYNVQDSTGNSIGVNSTTHTYPAALMADSITILSTGWSDDSTGKSPASADTTVNAAMLTGIVPSDPAVSGDYSGGVENFMRLLENWNGNSLWYNGSIVVMFNSQYATNHWRLTGNYYNAPVRHWAFDTNFQTVTKLPPLTPFVVNFAVP